jgi:hypothetical protein
MTKRDFQAMEYAAEIAEERQWQKGSAVQVRGTSPLSTLLRDFDSLIVQGVKKLELDSERLGNIRATLWVNFVDRDVFGFTITADEFRQLEAKCGLLGVLVLVLEKVLERSKSLQADVDKLTPLAEAVGACNIDDVPKSVYQAWVQPNAYQRTCAECGTKTPK